MVPVEFFFLKFWEKEGKLIPYYVLEVLSTRGVQVRGGGGSNNNKKCEFLYCVNEKSDYMLHNVISYT